MRHYLLWICIGFLAQPVAAQTCRDNIPASTPDNRFTIVGNEVTDHVTGLIWQRCSLGQTGNDCIGSYAITYTWGGALQAAASERAATGIAWRLPNLKELRSIVEERCYDPAINLSVFPNALSSYYWSGSPYAGSSSHAWYIDFYYGYSGYYYLSYGKAVRLVRGGQ